MTRILTAAAAAFITLALSASDAFASHSSFCNDYANQAMIAASQNMSHGCGFSGPRWGLDYRVHFNWCMNASYDAAMNERVLRKQGIVACHGGPTHNGEW